MIINPSNHPTESHQYLNQRLPSPYHSAVTQLEPNLIRLNIAHLPIPSNPL